MRAAVLGAGAMGSIFGARLAEGGYDIVLVDVAAPLVDKVNGDGITIVRGDEETVTRVRAVADPAALGEVDLVVCCVKCYHTRSAADLARPLVGRDTVVASLQNGWGNGDVLAEIYPPEQIVIGVTYHSGTVLEPGRVAHTGMGPTTVGPYAGDSSGGAERLASALTAGGVEVHVVNPIRPEIWKKLILNAATLPTAALAGMSARALTEQPDMHELVSATAREATTVARALGYDIDAEERVQYIHGLLERAGAGRASMLQDFDAGRRTEVDVINGAVVKAGDEHGVPVPLNRAFLQLVRGWESIRGLA